MLIKIRKIKLLQKLALGEQTARGVIQGTVMDIWRQIAHVCRDLLERTVK